MTVVSQQRVYKFIRDLGIEEINSGASAGPGDWSTLEGREYLDVVSPIDESIIAKVALATSEDYEHVVSVAKESFLEWRLVPAPKRGIIVQEIAEEMRKLKDPLGKLVTLEMGKIVPEGKGEVQEAIDIADLSVGLSRQLYG